MVIIIIVIIAILFTVRETLVIVNKVSLFSLYTSSALLLSFPGAAEVEVTMQQQFSTHVKINLAHLLHLDNE